MQDFNRVWDLNIVNKRRIEQFHFFNWLLNVKNLVFLNRSKHVRLVKKLQNIAKLFGTSLTDPPSLRRLGDPPPNPVSDAFEFTQYVSQFEHFHFLLLV